MRLWDLEKIHVRDEGTMTRDALEEIWSAPCPLPSDATLISLFSSAKDLLILAVRRIVERTVSVFPSPMSSASIPPNVSFGVSAVLVPVMSCSQLKFLIRQNLNQPEIEFVTYKVSPPLSCFDHRENSAGIGPSSRWAMKSIASSWCLRKLKIVNGIGNQTAYGSNGVVILMSASNRFNVLYLVKELNTLASLVWRASPIVELSPGSPEEVMRVSEAPRGVWLPEIPRVRVDVVDKSVKSRKWGLSYSVFGSWWHGCCK